MAGDEIIITSKDGDVELETTGNASLEYKTDGNYVGPKYDRRGGIWVDNRHIKNFDNSIMSIQDFKDLVGTIYEEASVFGSTKSETKVTNKLWQEAAAMYCVIWNRAKAVKIKTFIEIASEPWQFNGWKIRNRQVNILDTSTDRTKSVIKGFIAANLHTDDYSNDACFWDGSDIKSNKHFTEWGIHYTDQSHDIYDTKESMTVDTRNEYHTLRDDRNKIIGYKHPIKNSDGKILRWNKGVDHNNLETEIFTHKLDSTAAVGGTVFWKYYDTFRAISRQPKYN